MQPKLWSRRGWRLSPRLLCAALIAALAGPMPLCQSARAWGDEGHQIGALIARANLTDAARQQVDAMLLADTNALTGGSALTPPDMISASVWADRYRDRGRNRPEPNSYLGTREWHFVDIEIDRPDFDQACFMHPGLPPTNVPASGGPAKACVVDKIEQFMTELANPGTDPQERIVALKFLLHFIGDVHQPLHAADDHDKGGNDKHVSAPGFRAGKLHHFWDTEFIARMSPDPNRVADQLIVQITPDQRARWSQGRPVDWALESFALARDHVYGLLPAPGPHGSFPLAQDYIDQAMEDVALQLSRTGIRLAVVLNGALTARQ
jgi:hypothetical protein